MKDDETSHGGTDCKRAKAEIDALERIGLNPIARRELLWIRAKEKGDRRTARDYERMDPGLKARMQALLEQRPEDRRPGDAYARLWHVRYDAHAGDLRSIACSCPVCVESDEYHRSL